MGFDREIALVIKAGYQDLRPSEQKVADYVLEHPDSIPEMSLERLAKAVGVSQPSVIRMVKALGYSGYKDFCRILMTENIKSGTMEDEWQPMFGYPIQHQDKVCDVPKRVGATTLSMVADTIKSISVRDFQKVIEAIGSAARIEIFGVENSGAAASDLHTKLLYLGLDCKYCSDTYLQKIGASCLQNEDVAIGISYSGCARDTVDVMEEAKNRGAVTIAVTNFRESLICRYADLLLCTSQEQLLYGNSIFSRTTQMMIVDMIYTGLIVSDYERYAKRLDISQKVIRDKAYRE